MLFNPTLSMLPRLSTTAARRLRSISIAGPSTRRSLHTSPRRLASEVPKDPLADPDVQRLYEQIRNHQPAVDAMMNIGKLMQEKGFDTSKPPSMMQMAKIAMDKDLREAGKSLMEELKNAGIEINPETMKALMSKVQNS